MARRRNLKGIPHNITKSFFGTMRYSQNGYMANWLVNLAASTNIQKGRIDIFGGFILPAELNLPVFDSHIADLKNIIFRELTKNNFSVDFIVEAGIDLEFQGNSGLIRAIHCYPFMVDKEGRRYEGGRIIEYAYEEHFDAWTSTSNKKIGFFSSVWRRLKR